MAKQRHKEKMQWKGRRIAKTLKEDDGMPGYNDQKIRMKKNAIHTPTSAGRGDEKANDKKTIKGITRNKNGEEIGRIRETQQKGKDIKSVKQNASKRDHKQKEQRHNGHQAMHKDGSNAATIAVEEGR
eukprot:TRINITY_DN6307_c0_g1_i2.p1 TRINITY_DN6307_c0_g1~~TRINITY_DN6307_c0_g1_i2.p1  ORF type:complete len:128 (-),score=16.93 TRINITY_DN6307_c0_g1_i2:33-416(-)